MGSNRRILKAYVRYDGSGRVVPGSLILRKNKPKNGYWTEVQGYKCCNCPETTVLVDLRDLPYLVGLSFELGCFDSNSYTFVSIAGAFTTLEEIAAALNAHAGYLGHFSAGTENIILTPNPDICTSFTPCTGGMVGFVYPTIGPT